MGQWGRFSQIKHEAYPKPLNYTVSASVRRLWVERKGGLNRFNSPELPGLSGGYNTGYFTKILVFCQLKHHIKSLKSFFFFFNFYLIFKGFTFVNTTLSHMHLK